MAAKEAIAGAVESQGTKPGSVGVVEGESPIKQEQKGVIQREGKP